MISETLQIFLEENGYTMTTSGPVFYNFIKKQDSVIKRIEIDPMGIEYCKSGKQVLTCVYNLSDEQVATLLHSVGAVDISVLKKFANA